MRSYGILAVGAMGAALLPGSGSGTDEIRHLDFEEWGAVFRDKVIAAALVDRLQNRCRIVNIRGQQLPHAGAPGIVGLLAAVRGLTIDPLSAMEMAGNDERYPLLSFPSVCIFRLELNCRETTVADARPTEGGVRMR